MATISRTSTVVTPTIERQSLWRDEVLDITYRVLLVNTGMNDVSVRCIGAAGKPWYDRIPMECFTTELTPVI